MTKAGPPTLQTFLIFMVQIQICHSGDTVPYNKTLNLDTFIFNSHANVRAPSQNSSHPAPSPARPCNYLSHDYLSVCLSICLSTYRSIYLSICLSSHLSIYPSIYLSIHPSIHLSTYLSIYPSIHLSIYQSIYRSIDLSIYLSIYPSIYLSIFLPTYVVVLDISMHVLSPYASKTSKDPSVY